jgi:hypothetical protein
VAIFRLCSSASCFFSAFIFNSSPAAADTTSHIRAAREAASLPGARPPCKIGVSRAAIGYLYNLFQAVSWPLGPKVSRTNRLGVA